MRKLLAVLVLAACALPLAAQQPAAQPQSRPIQRVVHGQPAAQPNPLLADWTTPYGIPPFEQIRTEHYLPAFEKAIAARKAEVASIAASPQPASFTNTVEALDDGGQLLARVGGVFFNVSLTDTDDAMQAVGTKVAPQLAALQDDVLLDDGLFARVKAVWDAREALHLAPEQARLLQRTYTRFVRGGALLGAEQKKRFRAINQELSTLGVKFEDNVLAETNAYRLVIDRKEDLAGLPAGVVAAAADAAQQAQLPGKWVFTLHAPSIWPFVTYAENRELRRQMIQAYVSRADRGHAADNTKVLSRMAALRAERARLLGFKTHADFILDDNMAKSPERVYDFLNRLWTPALAVAHREADALQAAITADGKQFKLEPWDWRYYAEKVRKARYDVDEEGLRPYFPLDRVREGAFEVAHRLYGLTFTELKDAPRYNPEVRLFEVREADGRLVGIYMTDYFPRASKRGGAWCQNVRDQWITADGKNVPPIVVNCGNFSRPSGSTPALLNLEEVETLFHEFGHALHALLQHVRYRSLGEVPGDFVELPSQIMENWATEPDVLALYARHWQTGQVIPGELVAKVKRAETFNQGFATVEYLAASLLDMDWHTLAEPREVDATAFEKASLERMHLMPEIVVRYRSPYFAHIFGQGNGYSAGYYDYIWAEVLDADAFQAFKEKGLFDRATATSFRTNVLERGGTEEAMDLYRRFRGREPSVEPLLERRGLKPSAS